MNQKVIITIAVVLIVLGGGAVFFLSQNQSQDTESTQPTSSPSSQGDSSSSPDTPVSSDATSGITIVFTDNGFDKASYTVKAGSTVTIKNESNNSVQFSSDDHPTHLENSELNMDEIAPGQSGSFTPTIKGRHGFHDHNNDHFGGTLVVE